MESPFPPALVELNAVYVAASVLQAVSCWSVCPSLEAVHPPAVLVVPGHPQEARLCRANVSLSDGACHASPLRSQLQTFHREGSRSSSETMALFLGFGCQVSCRAFSDF